MGSQRCLPRTLSKLWTKIRSISPLFALLIIASTLGTLQYGYHLAELNAPEDVITCRKRSIATLSKLVRSADIQDGGPAARLQDCIPMSEVEFATISSIYTLGGLIGALVCGPVSSRRGRSPVMRWTGVFYIFGSLIEFLADRVTVMSIGRLLSGAAAGASTVIVPLYISEASPPEDRGLFGAMTQISINIGILATQTMGYFFSHDGAWRYILGLGVLIGAVHFIAICSMPESPAWLASRGQVSRAKKILQRLRGTNYDLKAETQGWGRDAAQTSEEEALLPQTDGASLTHRTAVAEHATTLGFLEVVKDPAYRPAIIAVVGIMCGQQFLGINSVIMYSVSLFSDIFPQRSALLTILISLANLFATIFCSVLPDAWGRKTCLLVSMLGQGCSSLVLAISIMMGASIVSAAAVIFFVVFFAVGLGPVPFILASELVGQEAVGATQSWALGANYIATFIVAQTFPLINKGLNDAFGGQGYVYFIFAGFAVLFATFVCFKVPETNGKRDTDEVWGRTPRLD